MSVTLYKDEAEDEEREREICTHVHAHTNASAHTQLPHSFDFSAFFCFQFA